MKCALVLLISCCFAIGSSNAQGTYCGNAIVSNLNSNFQSLCSNSWAPRHYVYVPTADGEIEVCGTNVNVYRTCAGGSAQNGVSGTITGSCNRGNTVRYSVTANTPIYFRVYRSGNNTCVDAKVVSTGATGISKLCTEGTEISCGETINGDNFSGGNDFQTSDYTCFGGNDDFGGNDVVYKIDVPANENEVIFTLQPLQKDLDMFVYRCFGGTPICITRSVNSNLNPERIRITNAQSKTYYVIVDGYNANQQGTFTLEVGGCGSPQLPDFACDGGIPIECGETVNSNNFDTGNDFQNNSYSNCFNGSATFEGNDELYTLNLDQATNVTITLSNMTADLDLFVLQCNDNGTSNCIAASVNGPGDNDQVTLNNASGELFIVVEAQYTTSLSNFTLTVDSDNCGNDCPEDNLTCDDMAVVYGGGQSGALRYGFQVPSTLGAGQWTVTGGDFGAQTIAIGSSRTAFYTFPSAGTYTICYNYKVDGCDVKCCRTMQIANPYDCNDIFYAYDSATNRYNLNIPGIESATWSDDDANRILGTGTSVQVPVSGACQTRNFSALFFDPAVGAYRMCCISIYICDPYDCNAITFDYDATENNYVLNIPGIAEATWIDDDNAGAEIGTGTSVDIAVDDNCRVRNISVKFYDPGVNAYRICCLSLYVCNPYDCNDIQKIYDPVSATWSLSTPGLASSDVLFWQNDDTNAQIATGVNFVDVPHPSAGSCGNYSVLFFDQALQSYRMCCLQVCVDETGCTGTPSDLSCTGNNVVEDEPVCGCDGNTYESECDALAVGVFQWETGPCTDNIDPDCDALTYEVTGNLSYGFTVGSLNRGRGAWTITGPGFDQPRTIGAGSSINYTFPSEGTYEVCFVYEETGGVVEATVSQCCKTIEVVANPFDCDLIVYDYNSDGQFYTLTLPGVTDAAWQDDDRNISLGVGESINIPVDGACGIRNFTALYFDVATGAYSQCCISLYVCDPFQCDDIQKIYDPVTGTWSLSAAGLPSSDVLFWRNDDNGQSVATGVNFIDVDNPSAGSCRNYSLFYYDAVTESYRVCCLQICLDENGCTGTPSDLNCTGNNVVEDEPVCGCDGNTYESECDALAAGVQVWEAGPCAEPIDPDCDDLTFEYLRPLRYQFTVGGLNNGNGAWTISGPGFDVPRTIGSGSTVTYTFPQAGVYTICFIYTPSNGVVEGPITQCCKTIYITDDPYDCNDITYSFNSDLNRYQLTIPGIAAEDIVQWQDDDNNTTMGTGTTIDVPVSGACEVRNFSVMFFDVNVGYYRICCISLYICDPYDCDQINYSYNNNDNTYTLTIPDIQEATWLDDDTNVNLGTGNTVTIGVDGECRTRSFSVYFYDPGINAYRVCCISIYVCNPYDCDQITYAYDSNTNSYNLTIPGITDATWLDDDTNTNLGTGTTVNVPVTGECGTRNFSVYFFDPAIDGYRVCCIALYVCNPYDCDQITYAYDSNTNSYNLTIPGITDATWLDDDTNTALGTGTTVNVPVDNNNCGTRNFSVYFFDPAIDGYRVCCIAIYVCNPYDCDQINYVYNSTTESYDLTIPGITDATWLDDDTNTNLGTGTTVSVQITENCTVRNFSVYFFDPAVDGYRVCCISIYICDPFDCNDMTYTYDAPTDSYVLSIPTYLTDPQWLDDDTNMPLGNGSSVSIPLNGECGVRNFSVYFFDPAIDGYRVCCIRLFFCDPNSCDAIDQTFDQANNTLGLSLPGVAATDVLFWTNGDTGQQIAGATSNITVNNPAVGECLSVCAYFYDASFDGYRQCCIELCNDQPACAGIIEEAFDCLDDDTYNYSFTLENFSGQTVDAEFIMLTPGLTFDDCSLTQTITSIGASQAITLNIDDCVLPLSEGMQITYKIVLREAGKTEGWCCHLDPITITLPTCIVPCEGEPQPDLVCTEVYAPVCGCNDVTYSNECYAQQAGITAWEAGPCAADQCDNIENLVKNGAFEGGNWAFTSDYGFQCYCGDDNYCVNADANSKCNTWASTTGDGKFLIIEGEVGGANKRVWRQNVAVSAGLDYTFFVDFYPDFTAGSQPVLQFFINGNPVGSSFQGVSGAWTTYGVNWNAPSTAFVNLEIRKIGSTGGTNDFGIDNVRFEFCLDDVNNPLEEHEDSFTTNSPSTATSVMASPNPFTDITTISFTLDKEMPATVSVFNVNGKQVFMQEGQFEAGINTVEFEADASLSAGVYYYRLETATETLTKSMVLTRR